MATDVIRISKEAEERLEARKRENVRFTDVVIRLTDRDDDVDRFIGKYVDIDLGAGVEAVDERADRDLRDSIEGVRR